ncbi:lamin tail domain-containing protein [Haloarcula sp. H-GB4]|uniref:lamin tail domain-containing protein n=1 Tax=Haloarcula sp. H-GB4 TaxID=3069755 RepID=UPI0027B05AAC|nr:lamin tail domain-containing protein [Haloarcula sp. H-GB4]MDQ2072819.1 lamin tail domain-containing protein [Haloarcula sp. H-GB4]
MVWGNWLGTAERLNLLPGISSAGGFKAGGVAFVYLFVLVAIIGGVSPVPADGTTDSQTTIDSQSGSGSPGTATATPTETLTASTSVPTATATPTEEASPVTSSPAPATTTQPTETETELAEIFGDETETHDTSTESVKTPTPTPEPTSTPESTPTPNPEPRTEYRVAIDRIVDGDTVEIRYQNGTTDTLRLLGIDTPEVHVETEPAEWEGIPVTDGGRDHLRDWGHKASEYARAELEIGEEVRIVIDDEADRRGSYGRLLVYVYDDGELFNLELINQGYARFYDTTFDKRPQFQSAESDAQENDVGVWDYGQATPTETPTPTPVPDGGSGLVVSEIHEDAEGNDHENLNDEYVTFKNTGDETLSMGEWTVSDEADHVYTVPNGFELEPGATVTLYTGEGSNTESELYWNASGAVWNNGGDTIIVEDENSETVLERSY